jgi:hypothetical protein
MSLRARVRAVSVLPAAFALLVAIGSPARAVVTFDDSFEGSFKPSWTVTGEAAVTTAASHGFAYSFLSYPTNNGDPDIGYIKSPIATGPAGFASVWFYDDGASTAKTQMFALTDTALAFGLGVFTPTVSGAYACRVGGTETSSGVSRTTGWKEFRVEWQLGINVVLYTLRINGTSVCTATGSLLPSSVQVGDAWSYVLTEGRAFWDDVVVGA